MVGGDFFNFRNNVLCRHESNQHRARKLFDDINANKKYDWFYTEWDHYMLGHINLETFNTYIDRVADGWEAYDRPKL